MRCPDDGVCGHHEGFIEKSINSQGPELELVERCNFCLIAVEPIASVAASVVFGLGMDQLNCLKFATIKYLYNLDRREGCHEDVRRSLSRGKSVEYEREWQT